LKIFGDILLTTPWRYLSREWRENKKIKKKERIILQNNGYNLTMHIN